MIKQNDHIIKTFFKLVEWWELMIMKPALYAIIVILLSTSIAATQTTLIPDSVTMDSFDYKIIEFCMLQGNEPVQIQVQVGLVCQELKGHVGCGFADALFPSYFSVTPLSATTDESGYANILLETNNTKGVFSFTINEYNGYFVVGAESGKAIISESVPKQEFSYSNDRDDFLFRSVRLEGEDFSLVKRGEELWASITIENEQSITTKKVQVTFSNLDLGKFKSAKQNIGPNKRYTFRMLIPIPFDTLKNIYYPSLSVQSDCSGKRSKLFFLEVMH